MDGRMERDYKDALDGLRFSGERKEQMMKNLTERQAERPVKAKRFRPLRAGLIAAAVCAALLGTAFAAQYLGVRITKGGDGDPVDVWLEGGVAYYPAEELSGKIRALEGTGAVKRFESWDEMEAFIGVDLMDNPVLDASPAEKYHKVYDGVAGRFLAVVIGGLDYVNTMGCYEIGDVNINVDGFLYTDRVKGLTDERFLGYSFPEWTEVGQGEFYTAPSGLETQIMEIDRPAGHRDTCLAAFSLNGVPFVVRAHSDNSLEEAREALLQVLDGFQV